MKKRRRVLFALASGVTVLAGFAAAEILAPRLAHGFAIALGSGVIVYVILRVKDLLAGLAIEGHALLHMSHLPLTTAVPWSGYALAPRVLDRLLFEIGSRGAGNVVECGSGVSTLAIAQTLRSLGKGHLYTIEHDPRWAQFVERMLEANGLASHVTLIVAQLQPASVLGVQSRWYDAEAVVTALHAVSSIDVLVVDGPPEGSGLLPRVRALPFFAARLSPEALVLVDDLHRTGEQQMVTKWANHYDLKPIEVDHDEGYGFYTVGLGRGV